MEENREIPANTGIDTIVRDEKGRFVKGAPSPNPLGHKEGLRHKATVIKQAFFEVFEQMGGVDALLKWVNASKTNQREFYRMILTVLPKELEVRNNEGDKLIIVRAFENIEGTTKEAIAIISNHE